MSKAVKAVTKAVGGVYSGVFGGGGKTGALGTGQFKGSTRQLDKANFQIQESKEAASRARDLEKESKQRSEQAQTDRRSLIESLQAQASGTAPSLAEAQLRSASDRSLAQQLATAQSQRGGSAASRERQLLRGQAQAGRELAQDATTARLQERQMAQQQLGDQVSQEQQLADQLTQNYLAQGFNIEQARQQALQDYEQLQTDQFIAAQGLSLSGFQSAAQQRGELFGGMMSGLGSVMGMSDERSKKKVKKVKKNEFVNLAADQEKDEEPKMTKEQIKEHNKKQAETGIKLAKERRNKEKNKDFHKVLGKSKGLEKGGKTAGFAVGKGLKDIFSDEEVKINKREVKDSDLQNYKAPAPPPKKEKSGMGDMMKMAPMAVAALSDKNSKQSMKSYSDKSIKKDFLDKLEAYTYEYKDKYKDDPKAGEGRHMSVMAQDLEKAGPLGKNMVKENEEGVKMVDYAKGYGAILAAQAHLNKRLDELEKKSKKRK